MFPVINEQMDIIRTGTVEIIPEEELLKKIEYSIKKNKSLKIKLGCDPSKPDLHIGHAVVLHKMRQFQDLGHEVILIIGDFTAMIGDPSGKSKTRPQLTMEETRINGQSYLEQAGIILSKERLQVRYNSEWLSKMNFNDVINLAAKYTVAQILERDDFDKRYTSGQPISIHELLYPLAQAMDSVAIESDVELGGTDQKFNLLVGREIQRAYDKEPQCIITMPILEGTDGIEKMSKSLNNYVALQDVPREMFGKIMSIPDNLITKYLKYAAFASDDECKSMEMAMEAGSLNPRDAKVKTAMSVINIYHGETAAQDALIEFERMFKNKGLPDDIPECSLEINPPEILITELLVATKLVASKNEARTLVTQNAVSVDDEKVNDPYAKIDISHERLIKAGKRKFIKVKAK
jgi:tyrosyl-tRNA synthetase